MTSKNRSPLQFLLKKKKTRLCMKSPTPEAKYAQGVFQIQFPICVVNVSNNISATQVRVNERKNLTRF